VTDKFIGYFRLVEACGTSGGGGAGVFGNDLHFDTDERHAG